MAVSTTRPGRITAFLLAALLFVPFAGAARSDDPELAELKAERKAADLIWEGGSPDVAQLEYEALLLRIAGREEQPWVWFGATLKARLGTLHRQLVEPDVALSWWREALDDYQAADRWVAAGRILANLAVVEAEGGGSLAALSWLDEAIAMHEAADRPDAVALDLYQRARVYDQRGEVGQALADLLRALELYETEIDASEGSKHRVWYLYCRGLLAYYAHQLGEFRLAAQELHEVLLDPALQDPRQRAAWRLVEAGSWAAAGEMDRAEGALALAREDIEVHQLERFGTSLLYVEARLALNSGRLVEGCEQAQLALDQAQSLAQVPNEIATGVLVARCLNQLGEHEDALLTAQAVGMRALNTESVRGWSAWYEEAVALAALGDLQRAADAFEEAARGLAEQLDELRLDAVTMGRWRVEVDQVFDAAASTRLAVARGDADLESALDLVEQSRSRLLLAAVLGGEAGRVGPLAVPPEPVSGDLPGPTRRAAGQMNRVRRLQNRPLLRSVRPQGPRPARSAAVDLRRSRTLGGDTLPISELRERLPRNTGVVVYRTDMSGTDIFWVERGRIEVHRLAGTQDFLRGAIDRHAALLTQSVTDPALRPALDRAAADLRALILGPIEQRIRGVRNLVVVPDDDLYRVPFAALRLDGRYLVEQATVSVAPSLNVLDALRDREADQLTRFVGIADPRKDLPLARSETREAAALFDASVVLTGDGATEAEVLSAMRGADVLHLATHGELEATGDPSWLALAGDGRLDAEAVLDLDLPVAVVVLSACRSARGRQQAGEALVNSMARSFLVAGAESVVGSLWDVHDGATGDLMGRFYEGLSVGGFVADSLADAQRGMALSDESFEHPWYWAGFVVVGDPR